MPLEHYRARGDLQSRIPLRFSLCPRLRLNTGYLPAECQPAIWRNFTSAGRHGSGFVMTRTLPEFYKIKGISRLPRPEFGVRCAPSAPVHWTVWQNVTPPAPPLSVLGGLRGKSGPG